MVIGLFRSADDGFIGHIVTLSFGQVPVAIVPSKNDGEFDLLFIGPDDATTVQLGKASQKNGGFLAVQIDCPALQEPISATMKLKASREGTYTLQWKRERLP